MKEINNIEHALKRIAKGGGIVLFGGLTKEDLFILRAIEKRSGIKIKWLRSLIKKFL